MFPGQGGGGSGANVEKGYYSGISVGGDGGGRPHFKQGRFNNK